MREEIEELRLAVNPARRFIEECVMPDADHSEPAHRVFSFYVIWAEAWGIAKRDILDDARFGKELRKVFPTLNRIKAGPRDAREYRYGGIRLANSDAKRTIRFARKEFKLS